MEIVLGIILLIAAVFLIVAVLMQNGKSHQLSGAIVGGAETFFGKNKGSTIDKMLGKITSIVAVAFCLIVVLMYIFQPSTTLITPPSTDDVVTDADGSDTVDAVDSDAQSDDTSAAADTEAETSAAE